MKANWTKLSSSHENVEVLCNIEINKLAMLKIAINNLKLDEMKISSTNQSKSNT